MKKVTVWSAIGSAWTAWFLFILVYVTIPDYPRSVPFWEGLIWDANGYWHEIWYITGGYLAGLAIILITRFWWALASFLETVRWVGVLPDGHLVFYRKKKKGV
jgi:hypothetical protein